MKTIEEMLRAGMSVEEIAEAAALMQKNMQKDEKVTKAVAGIEDALREFCEAIGLEVDEDGEQMLKECSSMFTAMAEGAKEARTMFEKRQNKRENKEIDEDQAIRDFLNIIFSGNKRA